jgi:ATP-dependent DNA helicase RecQ
MDLTNALLKIGVSQLRGKQAEAIDAINSGVDVVYLFPTGTGKTAVYEASALCTEAASLVVSPLIALLQQQADRLGACGVGVLKAFDGKVQRIGEGSVRVIYCTPEQTACHSALRRYLEVNSINVERLVVDEAHLVVQWDTFRFVHVWLLRAPFLLIYFSLTPSSSLCVAGQRIVSWRTCAAISCSR